MSRSPYNTALGKTTSSGKSSLLRQSAPVPADGALSGDGTSGWGLNSMLRSSTNSVTPRPPSTEPSPPSMPNGNGAVKSPMAFRARRFNNAGSGSDSDLSNSPSASSVLPDSGRRRSGTSDASTAPNGTTTTTTSSSLGRQLSSGSASSAASIRTSTGPSSNILAAFNGQSVHASLDAGQLQGGQVVVAGPPGKALRPKSSDTNVSNGGASTASTAASSSASKVLRTRLSEEGGHAAGAPTLSLREKLAILQRNNKALELQLAEASNEAQQRAAQVQEAHRAALAALQQRVAALEAQLAAQQRSTAELTQRNSQLQATQQQLQAQLAEARRAEAAAAAAAAAAGAGTPPPPLAAVAELHKVAAAGSTDGPQSPRTPLSWEGGAATVSPVSSTSSNSSSSGSGSGSTAHPHLAHGGGGSGSFNRVSDDTPPPHPHARPSSPSGADGRPHTAPHANYLHRSPSQGVGGTVVASSTYDEPLPPESTSSYLVISNSEPDAPPLAPPPPPGRAAGLRRPPHSTAASALAGDIYLAGAGPPPASPVAAAAGLSGAGVALLARQKKLIATLRTQLQQKDSAYAFLANEHSELEGQLKEVEAAKREYAARYAFMVLDQDLDGHIRVDQVSSFDMFGCYSGQVLEYAFKHWRFASGFKGYLNMEDFVRFVTLSDDRTSRDSQRFWFAALDLDGDGAVSAEDAKWFYDAVEKDESAFVVGFEDLWHQILDMTQPAKPRRGFTASELWRCKLGAGVIGLLLNHNNMLLHRTTAEWGRGDFPL